MERIPAAYKPLQHHFHPKSHHTQYPTGQHYIFQLFLHTECCHWQDEYYLAPQPCILTWNIILTEGTNNKWNKVRLPGENPEQRTETSFKWVQLVVFWTEPRGVFEVQLNRDASVPVHVRSPIQMGPLPPPNRALPKYSDSAIHCNHCV